MSAAPNGAEPRPADLLAPWKATDKLDAKDAALFERLMAEDAEIAHRLAAAVEERQATIDLNETLPAASAGAREALFARIEAYEARRARRSGAGLSRWLAARLTGLSPGALAWSATAAALVIALQAGLLTQAYLGAGDARYETASDGREAASGQTLLVGFQPSATARDIAALLAETGAEIVGVPKPSGVFVVRIAERPMPRPDLDAAVKRLQERSAVVRFVAPPGGAN